MSLNNLDEYYKHENVRFPCFAAADITGGSRKVSEAHQFHVIVFTAIVFNVIVFIVIVFVSE